MIRLSVILACCVVALTVRSVAAQPFFGGGVVAFDPEISTVSSGAVVDAQPVVSYDRKYVTLNMQVQDSRLIALQTFQVSALTNTGPALGFVGGVTTGVATGVAAGKSFAPIDPKGANSKTTDPKLSNSPAEIERRAIASRSVLARRGMFLLCVN